MCPCSVYAQLLRYLYQRTHVVRVQCVYIAADLPVVVVHVPVEVVLVVCSVVTAIVD